MSYIGRDPFIPSGWPMDKPMGNETLCQLFSKLNLTLESCAQSATTSAATTTDTATQGYEGSEHVKSEFFLSQQMENVIMTILATSCIILICWGIVTGCISLVLLLSSIKTGDDCFTTFIVSVCTALLCCRMSVHMFDLWFYARPAQRANVYVLFIGKALTTSISWLLLMALMQGKPSRKNRRQKDFEKIIACIVCGISVCVACVAHAPSLWQPRASTPATAQRTVVHDLYVQFKVNGTQVKKSEMIFFMYDACLSFLIPYAVILLELLGLLVKQTAKVASRHLGQRSSGAGEGGAADLMVTGNFEPSHGLHKDAASVTKGTRLFISMATLFLLTTTPLQVVKRWPSVAEITRRPLLTCLASFAASCLFYASPFTLLCYKSPCFRRRLVTWWCCCCRSKGSMGRGGQKVSIPVTCTQPKLHPNSTSAEMARADAGVGACVDAPVAGVYVRRSFERIARRGRPYEATPTSIDDARGDTPSHCIANHARDNARNHAHSSFRRRTSWTCSPRHARSRYQHDDPGILETDLAGATSGEGGVVEERGVLAEGGVARPCSISNTIISSSTNQLHKQEDRDAGVILCDIDEGIACKHSICMATLPRVKKRRIGVTTFMPLTFEPKVTCVEHSTDDDDKERRVRFVD